MPRRLDFIYLLCIVIMTISIGNRTTQAQHTSLTPEHAQQGWLELFDGESTFGWEIVGPSEIKDGRWILGGTTSASARFQAPFNGVDYELQLQTVTGKPASGGFLALHSREEQSTVAFEGKPVVSAQGRIAGSSKTPITFQINIPANEAVQITRLIVKPVLTKSLFNGKNLEGWEVYRGDPKRERSKFEVTTSGELRILNGPGDLRTVDRFSDFILQLQCKTNGSGLNSGVFFRCIPEQYQNGYEAQIHNRFMNDDRTKPTDFGTGAIYRRIPARKVVSNDREWLTLTILDYKDQFTTWVNGYPTVSWKDTRKADQNPRRGLREEAGHISLQGHDPTTDILFRNIKIDELQ